MSVDPLGVVFLEAEVERGDGRHGAGDADRTPGAGLGEQGAHVLAHRVHVLAEPLGQADAADVEAHAQIRADDLELGRAAADVDDQRPRLDGSDPAQRERGFLLAGQEAGRKAVAPLDLAEKRLAVLGVAHRTRRDAECPLRPERLQLAPVLGEGVANAGDREGEELAPLVDTLAQPSDPQPADDLLERPVRVGDQETRRVRPQIDGRDPHLRGTNAVTRSTDSRTSAIASVSTVSCAREVRSRASEASRRVPLSAASSR